MVQPGRHYVYNSLVTSHDGGHTLTLAWEWEKGRLKAARLKAGSSETLTVDYRGRSLTMKLKKGKTYPISF